MKILVLNSGSSSLKYQVIDMHTEEMLVKGYFERIGQQNSFLTHKVNGIKHKFEKYVENHEQALKFIFTRLMNDHYGVIKSLDELGGIGHRVVQGGEKYSKPVLITDDVIEEIRKCRAHGTSHQYVAYRVAEIMNEDVKNLKIVNCHLGQGASVCAIQNGESVETSMGLTPLGGIPMGTRSGDLDPSVVTYIMKKENLTPQQMEDILNKQSGVFGISRVSVDFRDIENEALAGGTHAQLALDVYHYLTASYVAKCAVAMGGIDVLTFTAGVGEKGPISRKAICEQLEFFGVKIDDEKNQVRGEEIEISAPDSKVKVFVIPTNEELMIARETLKNVQ